MTDNITEEQMDLVVEVYEKHMDEYRPWVKEHGKPHLEEWKEKHAHKYGYITPQFSHFICTKFMEWKSSNQ